MKLVTVVGARPQFIKAAPFSAVFRQYHEEVLVHTGQHYDAVMSQIFFEELDIPRPDYYLGVGSGSHGAQTGQMLVRIEELLLKEAPDGVLVYGDTNSTLAGALAASKLHVPVFHIEAGLRSYNMRMPEEQNRVLTDHISALLLCPTETAVRNLAKEGIVDGVHNTGDIMYDAVLQNVAVSEQRYGGGQWLERLREVSNRRLDLREKEFYLATIHRAENTDDPGKLQELMTAFGMLDKPVLLPLHPRTRKVLSSLDVTLRNVIVIEPVGYLLMLYLITSAYMVLTDSGGLQKEAHFLKTPCTTLREQTEWVETLTDGWNVITPIVASTIVESVCRPLVCTQVPQPVLFGDGHAAERIVSDIDRYWAEH